MWTHGGSQVDIKAVEDACNDVFFMDGALMAWKHWSYCNGKVGYDWSSTDGVGWILQCNGWRLMVDGL